MNATSETLPRTAAHSTLRSYLLEAKYECLRLLRTPGYLLPTILFPSVFYLLFGIVLNHGKVEAARYLLASYGTFGVMGVGLFGFGVSVAIERDKGLLQYKRALPMPPGAYLFAKTAMAMLFATLVAALLAILAATAGGVTMAPSQWLLLMLADIVGVLPFAALGLFLGTLIGAQGAPAAVNMLYLPMSFLSGLWIPLKMLPGWIGTFAPVWPSYHQSQIALRVVGMGDGSSLGMHVAALLGATAIFLFFARRRLARG